MSDPTDTPGRDQVMTPAEFAERMNEIFCGPDSGDHECDHMAADNLMCDLLRALGYGAGVKVFENVVKWYGWSGPETPGPRIHGR